MRLCKGWNTPAKIKQSENIRDVIIAAVGALGVYAVSMVQIKNYEGTDELCKCANE